MDDFLERISHFSPKRLALLAHELQGRVTELEGARHEPIAIVGIGCRFPGGASTPERYWELLRNGVDAISEVPPERWAIDDYFDADPDVPGKMSTRWGGFLSKVDLFDPHFFGISPREAQSMDPQQRLLLEVAWEALEHAGISADRIAGTRTAVFIGMSAGDYYHLMRENGTESFDAYTASGIAHSIASGRLSYVLGVHGPSVSVDTACSSSMVAIHQAVHSLRRGECSQALAGGVNLILGPDVTIALSRSHMMAPDGRCKAFDSRADGFVRGEGCGVLVLKRLSDAQAAGDRVIAVIRGSAANQDGRSNGLTAPNGPAQEAVLREALADAQLKPTDVSFVEAHGTGTSLGDPIEVQALGKVMGEGRAMADPLWLGSVKANMGHMEAAAGVAGVIKMAMALQHREIPAQLHLQTPNPFIPWSELPVKLPTQLTPWQSPGDTRRVGGVSSFGFSGTNVHLLLEEASETRPTSSVIERPLHLFTMSARQEGGVRELAVLHRDWLLAHAGDTNALADAAFTANAGRAHFAHRVAVVAPSASEAAARISEYLATGASPGVVSGTAGTRAPKIAFLFTGQGSQSLGMARQLYDTQPSFRRVLDECDEWLRPRLPKSLLSVIFAAEGSASPINDTEYTQPALFAVEYALAQLWMSWGVRPAMVMGHSVGEYVAACVAGVFSLQDGLTLIAERGRLMGALPRNGAMVSVMADVARVSAAVQPFQRDVAIAAVNGPESVVISGLATAVDSVVEKLSADGIKSTRLTVSHAFHSPLLQPMLADFAAAAEKISYAAPRIDLVSNVTGEAIGARVATAAYWRDHALAPVQFAKAMATLDKAGCDVYLEVGPHPTLLGMGKGCLPESAGHWLPTLRRNRSDWEQVLDSLAALYAAGASIDWAAFDVVYARRKLVLASYPFQRDRYWAAAQVGASKAASKAASRERLHPLLGWEVAQSVSPDRLYETQLGLVSHAYLQDHQIMGALLLPSPAYMEMAFAAAGLQFGEGGLQIDDLMVHQALPLPDDEPLTVQLALAPPLDGVSAFRISSFDTAERGWRVQATGVVSSVPANTVRPEVSKGSAGHRSDSRSPSIPQDERNISDIQKRTTATQSVDDYYAWLSTLGLDFGPRFRGVERITRCDGEVMARMALPTELKGGTAGYRMHPALLDACFHVIGAALPGGGSTLGDAFLLLNVERIRLYRPLPEQFWNHVTVLPDDMQGLATRETFRARLSLLGDDGELIAEFDGLHFKRARPEAMAGNKLPARVRNMLHEIVWRDAPREGGSLPSPQRVHARLAPMVAELGERNGLDAYADFVPGLDELARSYIVQALRTLGLDFAVGMRISPDAFMSATGVKPRHRRLFVRMLDILVEDGVLAVGGSQWRVVTVPALEDADAAAAALLAQHPNCDAEVNLTRRCARELALVLRGEADPLGLLFPGGSLAETEKLYQNSPPAKAYNQMIAEVFATLIPGAPGGRPLRVLEIGAGTGSTTHHVLPRLPAGRVEYTFTDVSPLFLNRAREKFSERGFMRYELLDIGRKPGEQGFQLGHYDIIVGSNVLHATADLGVTVANVRDLLAPGGVLVILEGTTPQRFGDLTVGLLEGWWAYTDEERRHYALMSREGWLKLLGERGFVDAVAIPGNTSHPVLSQQAVFVAQAPAAVATREPQRWLIVPDGAGLADALAIALRASGDAAELLHKGETLRSKLAATPAWRGVVNLQPLDASLDEMSTAQDLLQGQERMVRGALDVVQALAAQSGAAVPALWMVTRGAQAALPGECANPAQATAWGMSHVVAIEHPELRCTRVDLDPAARAAAAVAELVAELQVASREDQLALRAGARLARRLVPQQPLAERSAAIPTVLSAERSYLVTGGLRGLGPLVGEWLADRGARHIVLMGRHAPDAAAQGLIQRLESRGVQVRVALGDVSLRADVERVLGEVAKAMPPLSGIVHSAGALDDGVLASQSWPRFASVMAAKVMGSWNLHTLAGPLDFLVLFSSGASVAGSAGQANHAAANAFEDALAWYRQSRGQPTVSINWGPWAEIGAAADRKLKSPGFLDPISPADGLMALEFAMRRDAGSQLFNPAQMAVLASDWSHLLDTRNASRESPLFSELLAIAQRRAPAAASQARPAAAELSLRERITAAAPNRRRTLLRDHVRQLTVKVLGVQRVEELDINEPLMQLGLDSLMAVELRNLLGKAVGRTLPATITFDHPSVAALVDHLASEVFAEEMNVRSEPLRAPAAPASVAAAAVHTNVEELSDDEIALQLMSRLDGLGGEETA